MNKIFAKIKFVGLIALLGLQVQGFGQIVGKNFLFNGAKTITPDTYIARDVITLEEGAEYSSEHGECTLSLDEQLICPNEPAASEVKVNDPSLFTSTATGSMAGGASVSPSGSAMYNIPIYIAPGTNGMMPSVSLVYNSQAGDCAAGRGFNISGLSAITRSGKVEYLDDKRTGVSLTDDDDFVLDGNRLIKLSSTSFRTEIETFSTITAKLETIDGVEQIIEFEVKTKDGKTIYYGGETEGAVFVSKEGKRSPLAWMIKKIKDLNGNYILFNYFKEQGSNCISNGQALIKSIEYTGTSSNNPYNKIEFFYEKKSDITTSYVAGYEIKSDKILYKIKSGCEGKTVRQYDLEYYKSADVSYLNKIYESNGSGEKYDPIVFNWDVSTKEILYMDKFTNLGDVLTGDFDGNGYTDILSYNSKSMKDTRVSINYYDISGYVKTDDYSIYDFLPSGSNSDHQKVSSIDVANLNKDNMTDIIVSYTSFYDNEITGRYIRPYIRNSGSNSFSCLKEYDLYRIVYEEFDDTPYTGKSNYTIADVDGNGYSDICIFKPNIGHGDPFGSIVHSLSTSSNEIYYQQSSYLPKSDAWIYPIEYDGDGIAELMIISEDSDPRRTAIIVKYHCCPVNLKIRNLANITT